MDASIKFKQYLKENGIKMKEAAVMMDITYHSFNSHVKRGVANEFVFKLSKTFPDLDFNWLFKEGVENKSIDINNGPITKEELLSDIKNKLDVLCQI